MNYELTVVAKEEAVEMVAEQKSDDSAVVLMIDFLGCRKLRKALRPVERVPILEVVVVAATFPAELRLTQPSNSNIPRRFWLDCCFLRCRPFQAVSVYNPSLCVRRHLFS